MKQLFTFFLLLSGMMTQAQSIQTTTAKSGLNVRDQPQLGANKIAALPLGTSVEVLDATVRADTIQDGQQQIPGYWVKIQLPKSYASTKTVGYVFDAFLEAAFVPVFPSVAINEGRLPGDEFYYSEIYHYLILHYFQTEDRSHLVYDNEFEDAPLCAFEQDFQFGIHYSMNECGEASGLNETLTFPKTTTKHLQRFINTLYPNDEFPDNEWVDEFNYAPDAGGCYFEIKQSANKSEIDIYCGC